MVSGASMYLDSKFPASSRDVNAGHSLGLLGMIWSGVICSAVGVCVGGSEFLSSLLLFAPGVGSSSSLSSDSHSDSPCFAACV